MIFAQLSPHTAFKSVRLVCKRWYSVCQWYIVQSLVWNDNRHTKSKYYFGEWRILEDVVNELFGITNRDRYAKSKYLLTDWSNLEDVVGGLFSINNNNKYRRTRLVWTSNGDMTTWSRLVVALARLDQEYQAQQAEGQDLDSEKQSPSLQQEPTNKEVPLSELVLKGESNFEQRFSLITPYLKSLTSLELHVRNAVEVNLDLELILFQTCPALIRLTIRGGTRPVHLRSRSMTQNVRESREVSRFRLKLKSLVLHNVKVDQVPLEHYLSLSPHLRELSLIRLTLDIRRSPDWRYKFISHIQQCTFAPHVKTFHLSFSSPDFNVFQSLTVADIQGLLNFGAYSPGPTLTTQTEVHAPSSSPISRLSNVSDWGFELHDITPAFKGSLFQVRNLVTSLTLTSNYSCTTSVESGLHDYLCASPLLLHLYTDRIVFQFASLDPYAAEHRRKAAVVAGSWSGTSSEYDTLMAPRGIWACRNLKSLHAEFSDDRPLENRWIVGLDVHKDMTHAQTRVIFGYLSRVCPNLEELHVVLTPVDLGLQSGLCLLSRLKRLERLEIAMSAPILFWPLDQHAWDWIAYRKTRLQAWLRAGELVLWDSEIREEEWQLREEIMELEEELSRVRLETELSRLAGDPGGDAPGEMPRLSTGSDDSRDSFTNMLTWDDLSDVGKLSDVKAALKDLYDDWRTPCWPMMEEFRVYGSMDAQTYVQSMVDSLRG